MPFRSTKSVLLWLMIYCYLNRRFYAQMVLWTFAFTWHLSYVRCRKHLKISLSKSTVTIWTKATKYTLNLDIFSFTYSFCLSSFTEKTLPDLFWLYMVTRRVSYKELHFTSNWVHPLVFLWDQWCWSCFSFIFCAVCYAFFVDVMCLLGQMFPVSLDCPFLSSPSDFSKDY